MASFGWAYINGSTFGGAFGPTGSIQFMSGSNDTTGSTKVMFHTAAYAAYKANTLSVTGTLVVNGTITGSTITASSFVGDGASLTGITADWDGNHTGNGSITGSLFVTSVVSGSSLNIGGSGIGATGAIVGRTLQAMSGDISGSQDLTINRDVMSNRDITAVRDIKATNDLSSSRDIHAARDLNINRDGTFVGTVTANNFTAGTLVLTDDSIVMTPSTSDTVTIAAATHGILNVTTVDAAGTAADVNLTADGQIEYRANDAAGHIFDINGTDQLSIIDGAILPTLNNDIDLGSDAKEFKDIWIDGTANLDTVVGGVITGSTVTASYFIGDGANLTGITAEWDGTHTGNGSITGSLFVTSVVSGSSLNIGGSGIGATGAIVGRTLQAMSGDISGSQDLTINRDVMSNRDITAVRDIKATNDLSSSRDIHAARDLNINRDGTFVGTVTANNFTAGTLVLTDDSIVMTPSTSDTVTIAAATHGILNVTTVDAAGTAADVNLTADGQIEYRANDAAGHIFDINGTDQLSIIDGAILPTLNNDIDLGSDAKEFKDIWIDGTGYIDTVSGTIVSGSDITSSNTLTAGDTKVNSLHVSGTATEAIRIAKGASETREIVFENDGTDVGSIFFNAAETMIIKNESNNDDIQFQTKPGGVATTALTIDGATANIGLGTIDPLTKLDVRWDPTGSLDNDTGGGDVVLFGSGSVTAGKMYYLSGSTWTGTDASTSLNGADALLGLAITTSDGTATWPGLLIRGFFDVHTNLENFSAGRVCYMSIAASKINTVAPSGSSEVVRVVGHCTDQSNVIWFNPSGDWLELA